MGISSALGIGSATPGVCTSSTRPTSPFEGQMIYETDTNRVLVYDNAAWVMIADTDQPPGLQLVKTETFAATNNLVIDDIFSNAFIDYRVILEINDVSASVAINFQFRDGTTNLGTSGYYAAGILASAGTSTIAFSGENNSGQVIATVPYTNFDYGFCDIDIYRPNEAQYTMFAMKNMNYRGDGSVIMESRFLNGSYQQTTTVEGMRFFSSGATFTGRYAVYGYRN